MRFYTPFLVILECIEKILFNFAIRCVENSTKTEKNVRLLNGDFMTSWERIKAAAKDIKWNTDFILAIQCGEIIVNNMYIFNRH